MPSPRKGTAVTIAALDPGVTTGVCLLSVSTKWLNGNGPASWEGLGHAATMAYHCQIGRYPMSWDTEYGRARVTGNGELESKHMPLLASPIEEIEPDRFWQIIDGQGRAGGGELTINDVNELRQVRQIAGLLEVWPDAALVLEGFTLREHSQSPELLAPVRLIRGVMQEEILHGSKGRTPFVQQPSYAMSTATDERLKRAGLYRPGMRHANDAARHAATFARDLRKDADLRHAAFPRHFRAR